MDTLMPPNDDLSEDAIAAARQLGDERAAQEPRALAIAYDAGSRHFTLTLRGGTALVFDASLLPQLAHASDADLANVQVLGPGGALAWPNLDMHVSVPGLIMDLTIGTTWRGLAKREVFSEAGRSRSPAKLAAARANGKKGGRPRKVAGG